MAKHGVIYIINNKIRDGEERFKVGRTYDLERRLEEFNEETSNSSNFGKFETAAFFPVSDTVKAESEVHKALQNFRIQDNREFFEGEQDVITKIVESITSKYTPEKFISNIKQKPKKVVEDYKENYKSCLLFAEQGHARAQSKLGVMYEKGKELSQSYINAHMWFNLSASQGNKSAIKNQRRIEKKMSKQQIVEAQEMARNWKPKK
jgi:hypothetical protein